jgi:hypothetical protein
MVYKYFTITLLLVLLSSCKGKDIPIKTGSIKGYRFDYKQYHNPLFNEIERFVLKYDTIPLLRELSNVILVKFDKSHDSLFVNIETSYYYPNNPDCYYFVDYYLIAFYNTELWPSNELIKKITINKIPKETYKSENEVHFSPFEPIIRKYLITNNDSMTLLKEIMY